MTRNCNIPNNNASNRFRTIIKFVALLYHNLIKETQTTKVCGNDKQFMAYGNTFSVQNIHAVNNFRENLLLFQLL